MITADKINPAITVCWFALVLLLIVMSVYGRQVIEGLLMKLYTFFIQNTPVKW